MWRRFKIDNILYQPKAKFTTTGSRWPGETEILAATSLGALTERTITMSTTSITPTTINTSGSASDDIGMPITYLPSDLTTASLGPPSFSAMAANATRVYFTNKTITASSLLKPTSIQPAAPLRPIDTDYVPLKGYSYDMRQADPICQESRGHEVLVGILDFYFNDNCTHAVANEYGETGMCLYTSNETLRESNKDSPLYSTQANRLPNSSPFYTKPKTGSDMNSYFAKYPHVAVALSHGVSGPQDRPGPMYASVGNNDHCVLSNKGGSRVGVHVYPTGYRMQYCPPEPEKPKRRRSVDDVNGSNWNASYGHTDRASSFANVNSQRPDPAKLPKQLLTAQPLSVWCHTTNDPYSDEMKRWKPDDGAVKPHFGHVAQLAKFFNEKCSGEAHDWDWGPLPTLLKEPCASERKPLDASKELEPWLQSRLLEQPFCKEFKSNGKVRKTTSQPSRISEVLNCDNTAAVCHLSKFQSIRKEWFKTFAIGFNVGSTGTSGAGPNGIPTGGLTGGTTATWTWGTSKSAEVSETHTFSIPPGQSGYIVAYVPADETFGTFSKCMEYSKGEWRKFPDFNGSVVEPDEPKYATQALVLTGEF